MPATRLRSYEQLSRDDLAHMVNGADLRLTEHELPGLTGVGEKLDAAELAQVFLPLALVLESYAEGHWVRSRKLSRLVGRSPQQMCSPLVIGLAGGVAVGKSTVARVLRELMARGPSRPVVDLVTTDGFLWPNAELRRRGLLQRKGFPESYDTGALVRFLQQVRDGSGPLQAPLYSHLYYDVLPGEFQLVDRPDILILEGVNVLQPPRLRPNGHPLPTVSDLLDVSVYVDADLEDVRRWYVSRFLALRQTAFSDPRSYFHTYADLSDAQAGQQARSIFADINEPNLRRNIGPTRDRASIILRKNSDHAVEWIRIKR